MQDFIRIGGAITSSPLNENFRRLLNAISISNTNLIFPEENAVVDTLDDMMAIQDPLDAQTCYVISSGELYRYSKAGNGEWVKIADFGQTFRQGFLNSGAVVLEKPIELVANSKTVLQMPNMLVYFKNQPGDNRYLKGMYLIEEKQLNIATLTGGANAYSIVVNVRGEYSIITGLPKHDDPNSIYLGTVMVNTANEILPDFVFTLPDIAYTADRGQFLMNGGQASGCDLIASEDDSKTIYRHEGFYYDEGINPTYGLTDDFPVDTDNGSNWNLKYFEPQVPATKFYYMVPANGLDYPLEETNGTLIIDKYWDGKTLAKVEKDYFTIQEHLVTPNGQNIILYGTKLYNSVIDAVSNINAAYGLDVDFPYIQATRIVVGNNGDAFNVEDEDWCRFYTMGRLAQIGTIKPEFADNQFRIYSGDTQDVTPSHIRFSLAELQKQNYNDLYNLVVAPWSTTREYFFTDKKFIGSHDPEALTTKPELMYIGVTQLKEDDKRVVEGSGYILADQMDLDILRDRVKDIECEIWDVERFKTVDGEKESLDRLEQSIKFRLFTAENRLDDHDDRLDNHEGRIKWMEDNKVYKGTSINGYVLGETTDNNEAKEIVLVTKDIEEPIDAKEEDHWWFTQQRVRETDWVDKSHEHYTTLSSGTLDTEWNKESQIVEGHEQVNPHKLTTDDIYILEGTKRVFVTQDAERRVRSDRLPDNTIEELAKLDAKNMDSIHISQLEGNSEEPGERKITDIGDVQNIRFYEDGAILNVVEDGHTLLVECKGQIDEDKVMLRTTYATSQYNDPTNPALEGYVDKALVANTAQHIAGLDVAGPDKYYGTNDKGELGIHDIVKFVTTDYRGDTAQESVYLVPKEKSIQIDHLVPELQDQINNNYHTVQNDKQNVSTAVNTFNFGNNIEVSVMDNVATISVKDGSVTTPESKFANLQDVAVTYTNNAGRMLVVNDEETGVTTATVPSLHDVMLKQAYTDDTDGTKVRKAVEADHAALATTANNALAVNNKSVDDTSTTSGALWTAEKIISNTSLQIQNEGVNTYSGTTVPSNSLGKNGDLYILVE